MRLVIPIILAILSPTLAISAANTSFFSKKQILNSITLALAIVFLVAFGFNFIIQNHIAPLLGYTPEPPGKSTDTIACLSTLTIFFLISEQTVVEIFRKNGSLHKKYLLYIFFSSRSLITYQ